jgi:hypothetical protein
MKTEVRMALESIEEELQKTNVCGYSAKIIRAALEESTNSLHNTPKMPSELEMLTEFGWERLNRDDNQVAHVAHVVYSYIARHIRC